MVGSRNVAATCFALLTISSALAEQFTLLTGIDVRKYPGTARAVAPSPGPGFPGTFYDGDRLAGTSDAGPTVPFVGLGTPLFDPNAFGAASLMFKRGTVPAGGPNVVPFMGIDFVGGPLLDLDGDLHNGSRSYVPVAGATPAVMDAQSFVNLTFDLGAKTVELRAIDATGTNEGAPFVSADVATVVVTLAGTGPQGQDEARPNPAWDTRLGSLNDVGGVNAGLVYSISDLRFEMWQDSIDPGSSSADVLGTLQYFGEFRGWLVLKNQGTGQFPALSGTGIGSTLWPTIDLSQAGQTFNTAHGLNGGTATIGSGTPADQYGPNGVALTDFGGDLGGYLDQVIVPALPPSADRFVYLESAGFGINNSFDPVFTDMVGYDVVLIGYTSACNPCDTNCDGSVNGQDIQGFVAALNGNPSPCSPCNSDANGDGSVNGFDIVAFVNCLN